MKRISILLAEDHTIVREGLRTLLELEDDFEVVGEAENGREAVSLTRTLRPMVVVMDIAMPQLNGFEATRQILRTASDTKILILSAYSEDEYVTHMISLGASGFLVKQNSGQVLVRAIRQVVNGKIYLSPSIASRMSAAQRRAQQSGGPERPLTERESEVLQLVAEGSANKQIADTLKISIKTVEKHRQHLMDKLNIHDTAGLTRHAIATGVIESSSQETTGSPSPESETSPAK